MNLSQLMTTLFPMMPEAETTEDSEGQLVIQTKLEEALMENPTFEEMINKVFPILPAAVFSEDRDGEILIHTGLAELSHNGPLVEFTPEDEGYQSEV